MTKIETRKKKRVNGSLVLDGMTSQAQNAVIGAHLLTFKLLGRVAYISCGAMFSEPRRQDSTVKKEGAPLSGVTSYSIRERKYRS